MFRLLQTPRLKKASAFEQRIQVKRGRGRRHTGWARAKAKGEGVLCARPVMHNCSRSASAEIAAPASSLVQSTSRLTGRQ